MFKKVAHIGIAVRNLKEASQRFRELLDVKELPGQSIPSENVNVTMFEVGGTRIELMESSDASSTIAKFTEKRGEGIHHVSFEVDDLVKELERLRKRGFEVLEGYPRPGTDGYQVAFLHPKMTNGVLVELNQKTR